MKNILDYLNQYNLLFVQTNYGEDFLKTFSINSNNFIVLTQGNRPFSPILDFVVENYSDDFYLTGMVSSEISNYLISLIKGSDNGFSFLKFFDEYFEFNELISRRNEIFIFISQCFLEILEKKKVEVVFIFLKDARIFISSVFLIKILLSFAKSKNIKFVFIEDIKLSQGTSAYELFDKEGIKFYLYQFFDFSKLTNKALRSDGNLVNYCFDEFFKWMAWESCVLIGEKLIKLNPNLKKNTDFVEKMVFALVGSRKIDEGIDLLLELLESLKETEDYSLLSRFYRLLGYLYAISPSRWYFAHSAALTSYELAKRSGIKKEEVLSKALLFFIGYIYGEEAVNFFYFVRDNKESFTKLYRHITSFYYLLVTGRGFINYKDFLLLAFDSEKFFKEQRDYFHLSLIYHFIANIFIEIGEIGKSITYDKKSVKIAKKLFLPNISHIYNSLSYISYTSGNFKEAYNYSLRALKESLKELDIKEVCMTLVNFSYLYMILNDFPSASNVLSTLLKVKEEANFKKLPIHSDIKLWVMDMYIRRKQGESSVFAKNLLSLSKKDILKQDTETISFYYWGLSMIFGDTERKVSFLKKALNFITKEGFEYVEVKILKDLIETLEFCGNKVEASRLKTMFLDKRRNYKWYGELLSSDKMCVRLPKLRIQTTLLLEEAKNQRQFVLLESKRKDANFLLKVQEILLGESDESKIISRTIRLINNSFLVKNVVFWDKVNDIFIYSEHLDENLKSLIKQINLNDSVYSIKGKSSFISCYAIIPVIFSNREVKGYFVLFSDSEDSFISYDNFNFIKLAISFLTTKLEAIRYVKKVEELAKTDFLTGLYNRIEIENFLAREIERCKRNKNYNFSLVMIDLDNFKYYNDTFGHLIGDLILKEFSTRLLRVVRKYDFVGRFGGDEFVVIMPHTDLNKAKQAVKRWYKIFEDEFYLDIIFPHRAEEIKIPRSKRLSMSIGISDAASSSYDIFKILSMADESLYYAKRAKKS
ncbi:MAG: tetratricopeptide repeat-containing diguanylate cyclase [Brevinematia bacterium]